MLAITNKTDGFLVWRNNSNNKVYLLHIPSTCSWPMVESGAFWKWISGRRRTFHKMMVRLPPLRLSLTRNALIWCFMTACTPVIAGIVVCCCCCCCCRQTLVVSIPLTTTTPGLESCNTDRIANYSVLIRFVSVIAGVIVVLVADIERVKPQGWSPQNCREPSRFSDMPMW